MNNFIQIVVWIVTVICFTNAVTLIDATSLTEDGCQNYIDKIENEFIPISQAIEEDISLLLAGYDRSGEKFYICKVDYNGKTYLGRGKGTNKCWFSDGEYEAHIRSGFSVLREPKDVKLVWKNVTTQKYVKDKDEMASILILENAVNLNENSFFGRCIDDREDWTREPDEPFQRPSMHKEGRSKRFIIIEEHPHKNIVPGLIEFDDKNNSTKLQITWNSYTQYCKNFETLVCQ